MQRTPDVGKFVSRPSKSLPHRIFSILQIPSKIFSPRCNIFKHTIEFSTSARPVAIATFIISTLRTTKLPNFATDQIFQRIPPFCPTAKVAGMSQAQQKKPMIGSIKSETGGGRRGRRVAGDKAVTCHRTPNDPANLQRRHRHTSPTTIQNHES